MNQELFAFWKNDLFPYCLGGKIEKIEDGGNVYIPSYQTYFKPIIILPAEQGIKIKEQLIELSYEYKKEQEALKEKYMKKLNEIIPFKIE